MHDYRINRKALLLLGIVVLLAAGLGRGLATQEPYVVGQYKIVPGNEKTLPEEVQAEFLGEELSRIASMKITLYSDDTVETTGWPLAGINLLQVEKTDHCDSGKCIEFSTSEGYSGRDSGYSLSYLAVIDQENMYVYVRFAESYFTWTSTERSHLSHENGTTVSVRLDLE